MKTRINLFSPQMLPRKPRLTAPVALAVTLMIAALVSGLVYHASQRSAELAGQVDQLRDEQQTLQQQLAVRSRELSGHAADPRLLDAVAQAQAKLQGLQQLAQLLDQDQLLIEPGFSNLMQDLSTSADRQVWLQQFNVARDQLRLIGQAQNATAVPAWIDRLGELPSLQGRALSQLVIDGDGSGPVRFEASHGLPAQKEGP
ncbi:PilN domain-containing protein [Ferrimonas pelagia]|uniref:PilN domain-containing protein n=1 Tax=Ferrimonas pelagia TaxID=1177826 RepID=A0ABP9FHN1_9GAMM